MDPGDERARAFVSGMVRAYGFKEIDSEAGPRKKVLPLPGFIREPLSRAFLKQFIADTAAYFFDAAKRAAIRKRLTAVLPGPGTPVTIVAHSQGSIVAVEVLAHASNIDVVKLVTIGSPLGLPEKCRTSSIYSPGIRLLCADGHRAVGQLRRPAGSGGARQRARGRVHPTARHADGPSPRAANHRPDCHQRADVQAAGVQSAFRCGIPGASQSAPQRLRAERISTRWRDLVARDIAEALGHDDRHPVLIEVLEPGYRAIDEAAANIVAAKLAGRTIARRADRPCRVRSPAAGEGPGNNAAGFSGRRVKERLDKARINPLRRFVAAHLIPDELRLVAPDQTPGFQRLCRLAQCNQGEAPESIAQRAAGGRGARELSRRWRRHPVGGPRHWHSIGPPALRIERPGSRGWSDRMPVSRTAWIRLRRDALKRTVCRARLRDRFRSFALVALRQTA